MPGITVSFFGLSHCSGMGWIEKMSSLDFLHIFWSSVLPLFDRVFSLKRLQQVPFNELWSGGRYRNWLCGISASRCLVVAFCGLALTPSSARWPSVSSMQRPS